MGMKEARSLISKLGHGEGGTRHGEGRDVCDDSNKAMILKSGCRAVRASVPFYLLAPSFNIPPKNI